MMNPPNVRVVVAGASPDAVNRNAFMRGYVASGFASWLGAPAVVSVSFEAAALAVERYRPALVVVFGSCMPDSANYYPLRKACDDARARLTFWLHDDPYEFDYAFRAVDVADVVFSNDRWATCHYRGGNAHHLPMAADPVAHRRPIDWDRKDIDVFFCGVAFRNRIALFDALSPVLRNCRTVVLGDGWPGGERFAFAENRRLGNRELTDHYARARVVINVGRDLQLANRRYQLDASSPGPRTFEAAAAGVVQACFVEGLEIVDYFTPDREVALFDSLDGFERVLAAALNGEGGALIASAAQQRVEAEHFYQHRAGFILRTVGVPVEAAE